MPLAARTTPPRSSRQTQPQSAGHIASSALDNQVVYLRKETQTRGSTTPRLAERSRCSRCRRASLLRVHPSVRGRQGTHRPRACRKIAGQNLSQPSLIALAYTSERKHKDCYAVLERNNKDLQIDGWMTYFANTILKAQDNTIKRVDFHAAKAKFYEKLRDQINERQAEVIARMFKEGIEGFKGRLSADNYISISKTWRATATRDLQDLVEKGALPKIRELRHTRYFLNINERSES
jgi:hypothetical protein